MPPGVPAPTSMPPHAPIGLNGTPRSLGFERGPLAIIGWAAYLACSWTWCIGMWLPVLLRRDFAPPLAAFAAFAIPNCLGAAAMGFILRRPGASERFLGLHGPACLLFSAVTVAFQWFFLTITLVGHGFSKFGLTLIALAIIVRGLGRLMLPDQRSARTLAFSGLIFLGSLTLLVWYTLGDAQKPIPPRLLPDGPETGLPFIAAASVFGFLLCPYLDLTFHRVASDRTALDGFGRSASFGIGFLLFFAAMIGFTAIYAPHVLASATASGYNLGPAFLPAAAAIHVVMQLMFTIAAHDAAGERFAIEPPTAPSSVLANAVLAAPLVGVGAALLSPLGVPGVSEYSYNETVYRAFMGFYALLFPAYVLVCVVPNLRGGAPPSRGQVLICAATCLIALPMFAAAFLFHRAFWLAPALVILAAAVVPSWLLRPGRSAKRDAPDEPASGRA